MVVKIKKHLLVREKEIARSEKRTLKKDNDDTGR